MGMLMVAGDVPWEWLAGCRVCGAVHELRPDLDKAQRGIPAMTDAAPHDGHGYRPRMPRYELDVLMVEHRAGDGPPTTSSRLLNPPAFHVVDQTWTRLPDDNFEVHHEQGGSVRVAEPVAVRIRRVGS